MKIKKLTIYGLLITCFATTANASNATVYDKVSITPKTWQEIDLTYINTINGKDYTEQVNLLRPISWIKQNHLDKVGSNVSLNKDQIGQDVDVKVVAIKPTKLNYSNNHTSDTNKPVITTFIKHSDDVWDYTFKDLDGTKETIQATSNHPFYSLDRNDYIPIGQIRIGEHLKSDMAKDIVLNSKLKHNNAVETVYNFEVYQAHNYKVGNSQIIVHNMNNGGCNFFEELPFHENISTYYPRLLTNVVKYTNSGDLILGIYEKGSPSESIKDFFKMQEYIYKKMNLDKGLLITSGLATRENSEVFNKFQTFLSQSEQYKPIIGKSLGEINRRDIPILDIAAIDYTINNNNKLLFVTDNVDIGAAFDKSNQFSKLYRSLTSNELRYIDEKNLYDHVIWWEYGDIIQKPGAIKWMQNRSIELAND